MVVRTSTLLAVLAATVGALVAAAAGPAAAAEPPLPPFVQVDAGSSFACAVSDGGDA